MGRCRKRGKGLSVMSYWLMGEGLNVGGWEFEVWTGKNL